MKKKAINRSKGISSPDVNDKISLRNKGSAGWDVN